MPSWRKDEKKEIKQGHLVVADAVDSRRFPVTSIGIKKSPVVNMPKPRPGSPIS